MKTEKRITGDLGENTASSFLIKKKYKIIERNYNIRGGEIDIIAWHKKPHFGETLCFIEVKTRKQDDGSAERATGQEKLNRLFKAARFYCIENNIDASSTPINFEQISVYTEQNKITHFIIPID